LPSLTNENVAAETALLATFHVVSVIFIDRSWLSAIETEYLLEMLLL
jgi:hypothetical protein